MTPDEKRGHEADRLLSEPLFVEAFKVVEERIVAEMKVCDANARDKQHELILMLQLLGSIHRHIKTVADTGKLVRLAKPTPLERVTDRLRRA